MNNLNEKKKHHYLPISYLDKFADQTGKVFAYRKDAPLDPLYVKPRSIGFERYYYSQPTPEGNQDNNRLEDFFSRIESEWTPIVDKLSRKYPILEKIEFFFQFMALQRARVPAARDAIELALAEIVRRHITALKKAGQIEKPPAGFDNILDDVLISIDPHRSIHAIPKLMEDVGDIYRLIGFEIIHNQTNVDFITSDNPVSYFGYNRSNDKIIPYPYRLIHKYLDFQFPISPKILVRGSRKIPIIRDGMNLNHSMITDEREIYRINRTTAKFGYRFIFSQKAGIERLVAAHAASSPVPRLDGTLVFTSRVMPTREFVFGPRTVKAKWANSQTPSD
jgi:hypothetical protein